MLWSKKYETGNETVDGQHKEIFRLVQAVLDADAFRDRKDKIESALKFLADYAVRHFETEESLMIESNYPGMAEHKTQHEQFVKDVVAFMSRFEEEGSTISVSATINDFVVNWLSEHIMGSDHAMAEYYKQWQIS